VGEGQDQEKIRAHPSQRGKKKLRTAKRAWKLLLWEDKIEVPKTSSFSRQTRNNNNNPLIETDTRFHTTWTPRTQHTTLSTPQLQYHHVLEDDTMATGSTFYLVPSSKHAE